MRSVLLAASLAAGLCVGGNASAATITQTFDITGFGFYGPQLTPPLDPAHLSVTVTYDPTVTTGTTTSNVVLNSTNLTTASPFSFAYWTSTNSLYFGGTFGGAEGLYDYTVDYFVAILNPTTNPMMTWMAYSTGEGHAVYETHAGTVVATAGAAVPEPATWALMITGFGMAGLALRGRAAHRAEATPA